MVKTRKLKATNNNIVHCTEVRVRKVKQKVRDFVKHGACNMKVTILVKTLKPFFSKQSRAIYPTPSKNTTEQRKYIHTIEEGFFTRLHAGHTGILPRYLLSAPLKEIICYLFIWLTIQLCLRFSPRHYETLGYFSKHQQPQGSLASLPHGSVH